MKTLAKSMKFSAFTLSLILIAAAFVAPTAAANGSNVVSPALGVLAQDVTITVTGMSSGSAAFTAEDFDYSLGSTVDKVTILTLPDPTAGTLCLDGAPVTINQTISRRSIKGLTFRPMSATADASFYVTCNDTYATECHVMVIDSVDLAPAVSGNAAEFYMETMRGGSIRGSATVYDPEGESLELIVTKLPKKGTVTVTDASAGEFVYTPGEGKSGSDSFALRARDIYGNWSDEIAVSVRINKNKSGIKYTDLPDEDDYNAAVKMTDAGVMDGAYVNGSAYFYPDEEVTREQFVEMLMKTIGLSDIPTISEVKFSDDDKISDSARNYVRAARKLGFISGSIADDGTAYFNPTAPITRAEVAVILQNVIHVDVTDPVPVFADSDSIPAWALESVIAVRQLGVMSDLDGEFSPNSAVSRANAASILSAVYDMVV